MANQSKKARKPLVSGDVFSGVDLPFITDTSKGTELPLKVGAFRKQPPEPEAEIQPASTPEKQDQQQSAPAGIGSNPETQTAPPATGQQATQFVLYEDQKVRRKPGRKKKNTEPMDVLYVKIDLNLAENLRDYVHSDRVSLGAVIEKLLKPYLSKQTYDQRQETRATKYLGK